MRSLLFEPLTLRGLTIGGRAWVSPMCQYSCDPAHPGHVTDWHLVHLGSFATGGAPLVVAEATAVVPGGRISPRDTGLWEEAQVDSWQPLVDFVHAQGSRIGVQLAHAGRKASTHAPFEGSGSVPPAEGGWPTVGPTDEPFGPYAAPRALSEAEVEAVPAAFAAAARRAVAAGFDTVELHGAHGYLMHQFLSPVVNTRTDRYGGSDEHRMRLLLETVEAVRGAVPDAMPVLLRLSATDWDESVPGGVEGDLERTVAVAAAARERGVDLVDVSSGGNVARPRIPAGPGYQAGFAGRVREQAKVATSAVGMVTRAHQAEHILRSGQADAVMLGRAALADPRWWHRAATALGVELDWPGQYARVTDRQVY